MVSCRKNENTDGASSSIVGSFVGRVQYQGNSLEVDRDNRLMRILNDRDKDQFKIEFYTGIPNITKIKFDKVNDSTWVSVDSLKGQDVRISGKLLQINYKLNSESWIVNNAVRK